MRGASRAESGSYLLVHLFKWNQGQCSCYDRTVYRSLSRKLSPDCESRLATLPTSIIGRIVRLTASYLYSAVPPTLSTSTVRVPAPPPPPQLDLSMSSDHSKKTRPRSSSRNDPDGRRCWEAGRAR